MLAHSLLQLFIAYVGINLGCADVAVSKQCLDAF